MVSEPAEWIDEDTARPRGGTYKAVVAWCGECGWHSAIAAGRDAEAIMERSLSGHRAEQHPAPVGLPVCSGSLLVDEGAA